MNFTKENRTETYMFTVKRDMSDDQHDNDFYKQLSVNLRESGYDVNLNRYGRQRDRIGQGIPNPKFGRCGHVPLSKCDRWDLYVTGIPAFSFLCESQHVINRFRNLIEYVNLTYKQDFEQQFPQQVKVSVPKIQNEYTKTMNPQTTADVNVTFKYQSTEILVSTDILHDVIQLLKSHKPFSDIKVGVSGIKHAEQHKDLPLVTFIYPSSLQYNDDTERKVRVTSKDDNYIEGFEGNEFKKFSLRKIRGPIELVSLGEKVS